MASENISDAICFPQDTGSGTSSNTDPADAWLLGKLASHVEGTYVDQTENPNSLAFQNINISTDTADVANGTAYIIDDSTSTANDRDGSGNPTFRSSDTLTSPDTSAPTRQPYLVVVPSSITGISLDTSAVNDIYISVNPTAQNDVTLHYGNGISTPTEPYIDLGTIDTTDGSTTRENDAPDVTVDSLTDSADNTISDFVGTNLTESGGTLNADTQTGDIKVESVSTNTTTSGTGVYLVDTSGGAVTLTLASADATSGETISVVNVDGSNAVTIDTEGSETIDPNAESSKTITSAGWGVRFTADGTNWDASLSAEFELTDTDRLDFRDANETPSSEDPATGTVDIDVSESNWWDPISATENITITLSGETSTGNSLLLYFEDGDTLGPYTITWPAEVVWDNGTVRDTIPASGDLEISLRTPDGGTTWRASRSGRDFA